MNASVAQHFVHLETRSSCRQQPQWVAYWRLGRRQVRKKMKWALGSQGRQARRSIGCLPSMASDARATGERTSAAVGRLRTESRRERKSMHVCRIWQSSSSKRGRGCCCWLGAQLLRTSLGQARLHDALRCRGRPEVLGSIRLCAIQRFARWQHNAGCLRSRCPTRAA